MAKRTATDDFLNGHLLIAMPSMADPRFARSVVYVCAHSSDGAMGIVINKLAPDLTFRDLLVQLGIVRSEQAHGAADAVDHIRVHRGGPVETSRGFVLHSPDVFLDSATLPIADDVCMTATLEILRVIADGRGPCDALLALGYAGWAPGQLEFEIRSNGWLHGAADRDLLFAGDVEGKYDAALASIGVAPGMLSPDAGHA
jgi:putative transcriptional regulator